MRGLPPDGVRIRRFRPGSGEIRGPADRVGLFGVIDALRFLRSWCRVVVRLGRCNERPAGLTPDLVRVMKTGQRTGGDFMKKMSSKDQGAAPPSGRTGS